MSEQMPPPGQQQPTEEEMRAAITQLRGAPVEQLVAEVLSALLNSAQMKIGRNDGRLLLDLSALVNDGARGHVDPQLTKQVDDAVTQLRMAQVEAEKDVAQAAAEGHAEEGDLATRPAPLRLAGAQEQSVAAEQAPPSAGSRLWTPGA